MQTCRLHSIPTVADDNTPVTLYVRQSIADDGSASQQFSTDDGQVVTRLEKGQYLVAATARRLRALYIDAP
jgi:hypothetical protein